MEEDKQCSYEHNTEGIKRHKKGVSSFAMHDSERVFQDIGLKNGDCFLDLGCGAGDYSLRASKEVGEQGTVYALDKWSEVTGRFAEKIKSLGIKNINAEAADILETLPIAGDIIDVCLLATVLHIPDMVRGAEQLFSEVRRVLKAGGRLAVIEIKKDESFCGPPMNMRLSPEEVEDLIVPCGFEKQHVIDLGQNYMIRFGVKK